MWPAKAFLGSKETQVKHKPLKGATAKPRNELREGGNLSPPALLISALEWMWQQLYMLGTRKCGLREVLCRSFQQLHSR